MRILLLSAITTTMLFVSCSDPTETKPLEAVTYQNLPADPPTGFNPATGQPTGTTGKFTFFSFATGGIIPNSDSLTNKWDLGFRGITIIVNGGTNRIGNGGAIIKNELFENITTAPLDGYALDGIPGLAIPPKSGEGWYTYVSESQTIIPTAGRVLIIRTGIGRYVKMEILSYYKDAPASPTNQSPARYYTFRYIYQPDGTVKF